MENKRVFAAKQRHVELSADPPKRNKPSGKPGRKSRRRWKFRKFQPRCITHVPVRPRKRFKLYGLDPPRNILIKTTGVKVSTAKLCICIMYALCKTLGPHSINKEQIKMCLSHLFNYCLIKWGVFYLQLGLSVGLWPGPCGWPCIDLDSLFLRPFTVSSQSIVCF